VTPTDRYAPRPPLARARRTLRIAALLQGARVKAALQYRADLLLQTGMGVMYQGSGFAFVWIVLETFPTLGGWTFAEVALLYAVRLLAHSLWLVFFNPLVVVDQLFREGEFDRYLVRPINPLVSAMTTRALRMGAFGDLLMGIVVFVAAASAVDVDWGPATAAALALAVVGGAMIETAVQLFLASLSFRWLETFRLRGMVEDVFNTFGSYPLKIFGGGVEWFLTFVVPVAFVAYLPTGVLLGKEMSVPFLATGAVFAVVPLLGGTLLWLAYRFWRGQIAHYQGVGH
jgi:ABC-2 type transport system permease protein